MTSKNLFSLAHRLQRLIPKVIPPAGSPSMEKLCFAVRKTLQTYEGKDWNLQLEQILDRNLRDDLTPYHPQFGYGKTWLNGKDDNFMLGVYGWHPGAETPCHEHGGYSHAFYHCISGEFTNEVYQIEGSYPYELVHSRNEILRPGQSGYLAPDEAHTVRNVSNGPACTIHCYFGLFEEHLEFKDGVQMKSTEQTLSRGSSKLPTFFDLRCVRVLCDDQDLQAKVYKKFYHCFSDVNGDLTYSQVDIVFQNLNIRCPIIEAAFAQEDKISESEFVDIFIQTSPSYGEVKGLFETIDRDHTGDISLDELQYALRGATLDAIDANSLFGEIDTNKSSTIELEELVAFATRLGTMGTLQAHC